LYTEDTSIVDEIHDLEGLFEIYRLADKVRRSGVRAGSGL
jgi:hypothetical protein